MASWCQPMTTSADHIVKKSSCVPAAEWATLDKTRFFLLGSALFSGVSATTYPGLVLKTRQQVCVYSSSMSSMRLAHHLVRNEGLRALYKGFGTSLVGAIPARALYLGTLELTKSNAGCAARRLGLSESAASATANAAAGFAASMASQLVWTPVDVISQRLMLSMQSTGGTSAGGAAAPRSSFTHDYKGGYDALRTILRTDGLRGLYRSFGISLLTYAPSSALTWAAYSITHRALWATLTPSAGGEAEGVHNNIISSESSAMLQVGVQVASAACAASVVAIVTTPLDTIKTRLQVCKSEVDDMGTKRAPSLRQTMRTLLQEGGGWRACYKGFAPRWATISISTITMITTYELLKRVSTKNS
ncbi:hypothetical protein L7F22_031297 [Adiantum nelumboides]|nr:hypothetical protein [Adiantum nelumboides]